ncbi:MAG: 2Fe-2S iron-sulfur cluster-binding protein [Candidatus Symbiobacter sp.]|nr:2Fe-2S iron-sulfur cluster-binding protein [Candidatus Symbiobacter sp.]
MFYDSRPKFQVSVNQTGEVYACAVGESLLAGMIRLGRRGIPVGCVNGGCGVCKVKVSAGRAEKLGPISRAHVTEDEENQGFALACRFGPASDLSLDVVGKIQKAFGIGLSK